MTDRFPAYFSLLILLLTALLNTGCFKDEAVNTDPGLRLRFSTDTILFDTTFTTVGSATRIVKIYNDDNQPVELSKVRIRGSQGLHFTCNVDGISGNEISNIRIESRDSIYVFCKVRVDPDQDLSDSPFVLTDYLDCTINGNTQSIVLVAWGQNANYITGKDNIGRQSVYSCNLGTITWNDAKPYVIYGSLIIDECRVIIPAGARVYVHGGLVFPPEGAPFIDGRIFVAENGQLTIDGTAESPVIFRGDRLEKEFKDQAGQWGGIVIYSSKFTNRFNYLDLRNSNYGVVADSATTLHLDHTIIDNVTLNCIIGNHATIKASNCLFSNSVGHNIVLTYGGNYSFDYCTVPNSTGQTVALSLDNYTCTLNELGLCREGTIRTNKAVLNVRNSILSGYDRDELSFVDAYEGNQPEYFQYKFNNCVLRAEDYMQDNYFSERVQDCYLLNNFNRLYLDENRSDYKLDSLSAARGIALPILSIQDDLPGNPRKTDKPDAGCYEYVP